MDMSELGSGIEILLISSDIAQLLKETEGTTDVDDLHRRGFDRMRIIVIKKLWSRV